MDSWCKVCFIASSKLAFLILLSWLSAIYYFLAPHAPASLTQHVPIPLDSNGQTTSPIPKLFHQMWKSTEISGVFANWTREAVGWHPDFQYVFWTDSDCDALVLKVYDVAVYAALPRDINRADLCRALVLKTFGGIYADMDTVFLRSLAPVLRDSELIMCSEPIEHGADLLNFALIASVVSHPFWDAFIRDYPANPSLLAPKVAFNSWQGAATANSKAVLLNSGTFAPLTAQEARELFQSLGRDTQPEKLTAALREKVGNRKTFAVHMWGWSYGTQGAYYHTAGGRVNVSSIVPSMKRGSELLEVLF